MMSAQKLERHTTVAENRIHVPQPRQIALIVDDDAVNRMILEGMMTQNGFTVLAAENGLQAVDLYAQHQPHVVLMDIMMPVMDGYEAASRIKTMAGHRFVPIIFLTAVTNDEELARCVSSGGDDFLTKPFSQVILMAKLQALTRMASLYSTVTHQRDEIDAFNLQLLHEQKVARNIYARLMNEGCLNSPNIRYVLSPLSIFNGDLLLAARTPSGGLNILLGDATGHGLPAAIGVVPVADIFFSLSENGATVEEIALTLNQKLKSIFPPGFFLCASILNFSHDYHIMTVFHGGLPEILIYSETESRVVNKICSANFPLGILSNEDFRPQLEIRELNKGDRVLLYSDGAIEARNADGEQFGRDRLYDVLQRNLPAEVILDNIHREIYRFRGAGSQSDDITMLEINADADSALAPAMDIPMGSVIQHPENWQLKYLLGHHDLQVSNPVSVIIRQISAMKGLGRHRENIFVVLSELYNNALDHGVLQLDSAMKADAQGFSGYLQERIKRLAELQSGFVELSITHIANKQGGGELTITVTDSGDGFDHQSLLAEHTRKNGFSGRGIALSRTLCNRLEYAGKGNSVTAVYRWLP